MKTNEISFEHKGIASVLAQNRLVVPLNQREYSWEEDHVRELFQDFSHALATKQGAYFLGTLVFTKGANDYPEVSDGQQRLATTTILLAAVRDYFQAQKDHKRAQHIADKYLATTDLKTTETVPRLRLNVDDHEFFRKPSSRTWALPIATSSRRSSLTFDSLAPLRSRRSTSQTC